MPVLSDLRHAYHTDGEESLPAPSMNYGVKRRPMRVKPSGGLCSPHVAAANAKGAFWGAPGGPYSRVPIARNCHIESLPLAAFQLIPP